jgi:hypothetical protein
MKRTERLGKSTAAANTGADTIANALDDARIILISKIRVQIGASYHSTLSGMQTLRDNRIRRMLKLPTRGPSRSTSEF